MLAVSEDIPGSTFVTFGKSQYLFLPKEGSYAAAFTAIGSGPTTVEIGNFAHETASIAASYSDIPVSAATKASFTVESNAPEDTTLEIDTDGDGATDLHVAPDADVLSFADLLDNLRAEMQNLTAAAGVKSKLLKQVEMLERRVEWQKQKTAKSLATLKIKISKNGSRGVIDNLTVEDLTALLADIEAKNAIFPLEAGLIEELRAKVTDLPLSASLKSRLLARVASLQATARVIKRLDDFEKRVLRTKERGKLSELEALEITTLLDTMGNML